MKKINLFLIVVILLLTQCSVMQDTVGSNKTLDKQLQKLTNQMVDQLAEKNKSKIAIVSFVNIDGTTSELGQYIAEELITRLYQTGRFEVIERQLLEKILDEHRLSMSGFVDASSAQEIGRILGVDAITSGSIADLDESVKVNARLISTETGQVFSVAAVDIAKDNTIRNLMGQEIQSGFASGGSAKSKNNKAKRTHSDGFTDFVVNRANFSIALQDAVMEGQDLHLIFTVTNQADNDRDFCIKVGRDPATVVFDDFGNEFPITVMRIANSATDTERVGHHSGRQVSKKLIKKIPTRMEMIFRNINPQAGKITLLQVNCCEFEFNMRDIPFRRE